MALIDLVKYNGPSNVFAWKFPSEELSTFTQLIVNQSQEAILVKEGRITDIFQAGRYVLDTANIPILNDIINIPFGGKSPFTAEVWYINKAYKLDIKWGTPSPIQLQDPHFGIFAAVRANGIFGIQITDSEKFLRKLVGTLPIFDADNMTKFFRGIYVTKVKDAIATYLVKYGVGILEINAHLNELSEFLKNDLIPFLEEYGITLITFYVNDISIPEDDDGVKQLKQALSKRAEMGIVGYNYQQERSFDTLEGAAKNTASASSSIVGAGLGMAMGVGLSGQVTESFSHLTKNIQTKTQIQNTKNCIKCKTELREGTKFCHECGQKQELSCPKCQHQIEVGMKFCFECGQRLEGEH